MKKFIGLIEPGYKNSERQIQPSLFSSYLITVILFLLSNDLKKLSKKDTVFITVIGYFLSDSNPQIKWQCEDNSCNSEVVLALPFSFVLSMFVST